MSIYFIQAKNRNYVTVKAETQGKAFQMARGYYGSGGYQLDMIHSYEYVPGDQYDLA